MKNFCYREDDQHREYAPEPSGMSTKGALKVLMALALAKVVMAKPAGRRCLRVQVLG